MPQNREKIKSIKSQIYRLFQLCESLCLCVFVAKKIFNSNYQYKVFPLFIFFFCTTLIGFSQIKNVEVSESEGISIKKIESKPTTLFFSTS